MSTDNRATHADWIAAFKRQRLLGCFCVDAGAAVYRFHSYRGAIKGKDFLIQRALASGREVTCVLYFYNGSRWVEMLRYTNNRGTNK